METSYGVPGKVYKELPITAGTGCIDYRSRVQMVRSVCSSSCRSGFNMSEEQGPYQHRTISVIELHTFLVTLVRQFKFSLPNDGR